jgi:hypothetical protein
MKINLKDILGESVSALNEDQASFISEKITKLVETKVDSELAVQTEILESEIKEKYNVLLEEKEKEYTGNLEALEETLTEKAKMFKEAIEEKTEKTLRVLAEKYEADITEYKGFITEKVDSYLELKMKELVPDTHIEAVAKVAVLEPIVEGFKKVMAENYIKFDEESFGLLKDARSEIISLRNQLSESVNECMDMNKKLHLTERSVTISEVCEGLTESQRERAAKLLEGYATGELKERFQYIREAVIQDEGGDEGEAEGEGFEDESKADVTPQAKKVADKDEVSSEPEAEEKDDVMEMYVREYKKQAKR